MYSLLYISLSLSLIVATIQSLAIPVVPTVASPTSSLVPAPSMTSYQAPSGAAIGQFRCPPGFGESHIFRRGPICEMDGITEHYKDS